ncbi:hypothetical protein BGV71_08160 [Burkholderia ubonensis]|uniref:StbB family protein n=1 Tax=Burkholderia ubonensis TaxID=101571 RepID=UPI0008FE6C3C|nr:StbB family protein [Burkholderia ubonensis]OJA89698.1 hypothetical protein BGV71_08160 [Burkholderia ubonensis]
MKAIVMNFSGNVGKSTIGRYLLAPRLNTEPITIETINSDEGGENISAKQFDVLQDHLLRTDTAVVDVGASNIEKFFQQLTQYKRSHRDFDYFIIPTVPERKQQADTIATIDALAALGVSPKKIRVVFNKVEFDKNGSSVEDVFHPVFAYAEAEKKCVAKAEASIYVNDIFEKIKGTGKTIEELVAQDEDELRAKMREAKDDAEKDAISRLILAGRLAESAKENLDTVYKVLFK